MIKFIKIEDKNKNICYINVNYIVSIEQTKTGSVIILTNDFINTIEINEQPDYIFKLINGDIIW